MLSHQILTFGFHFIQGHQTFMIEWRNHKINHMQSFDKTLTLGQLPTTDLLIPPLPLKFWPQLFEGWITISAGQIAIQSDLSGG